MEQFNNPTQTWQDYQASLILQHGTIIANVTQQIKQTYDNYQQQHQTFCSHTATQIEVTLTVTRTC